MHERETMSRLNAALRSIDQAYSAIAKRHGLSFQALMLLYMLEESQQVTQKRICDTLHLPKSTVHGILLGFLKQETVALVAGGNKKEKYAVLTEKGEREFAAVLKEMRCFEGRVLAALGGDVCARLVEAAESLEGIIKHALAQSATTEVPE